MRNIMLPEIRALARAAKGEIDRIFLHWSAGHYSQPFSDYHLNIDYNGEVFTDIRSFTDLLAHTWKQNRRAIGISMLCCFNATPNDLGPEPPTDYHIEGMAQVIAVLCHELELPVDLDHVRTHAEQADIDGYGPATTMERWDVWILREGDEPGSGGEILRGKAKYYLAHGLMDQI